MEDVRGYFLPSRSGGVCSEDQRRKFTLNTDRNLTWALLWKNTLIIRNTVLGLGLYTSLFSCRLPRLGLNRDDQGGVLGEVLQRENKYYL
jgi:hypothetical protein